jgi:DNA-binding SARP family transcriptional activator
VAVGGPRERALLALLVLRANTVLARDRLIDELWPDDPPESAVNILQTYVSRLRRALPPARLRTRAPGYELEVARGEVDLHEFEERAEEARRLRAGGDAARASEELRRALALWRGPALGDVGETGLVTVEAARLEELRLAALEDRIEADLGLGRHAQLVPELELLVAEEPLRERFRAQLMLALYRSGRQPEALAAYRDARAQLADELGIEPSVDLRNLEAAILRQDASLSSPHGTGESSGRRSLVVACFDEASFDGLLAIAEPLAQRPRHELVVVRVVADSPSLTRASELTNRRRSRLTERGIAARAAAFTSSDPGADLRRLATDANAAFLLVDTPGAVPADGNVDDPLASLLAPGPCDVAILAGGRTLDTGARAPVLVPFGGDEHDWVAAEIGAWIAHADSRPLQLVGAAARADGAKRDASRLLASVALLVQQVTDIDAVPTLVPPGADAILELARGAHALLLGVPGDWRERGIGTTRARLVRDAAAPVLLVRGGLRPGGISPAGSVTRFTWTIAPAEG